MLSKTNTDCGTPRQCSGHCSFGATGQACTASLTTHELVILLQCTLNHRHGPMHVHGVTGVACPDKYL